MDKGKERPSAVECAMNTLFSMLDEVIDDMENGRVLTIEELWKELDEI